MHVAEIPFGGGALLRRPVSAGSQSSSPYLTNGFFYVASNGYPSGVNFDASYSYCVCPARSF